VMIRTSNESIARDEAGKRKERWGHSVHDGKYYVGTEEQLRTIFVIPESKEDE